MSTTPVLLLSAWLFAIGMAMIITRRNGILMLIGTEFLLNAANLNFVLFGHSYGEPSGQITTLFIILVAVCEVSVGLAILIKVYHHYRTIIPDQIAELKEK